MAEIIESSSGSHKQGGRRTPRKMGAGVDMTPMVDLMCLLITFFMLTTAFSKPKVMDIIMPDKNAKVNPEDEQKVRADITYSVLIGAHGKLYWYWHLDAAEGAVPDASKWHKTKFGPDGIRKTLIEKNDLAVKEINALKDKVKTGSLDISKDSLNNRIKEIKKKWSSKNKSPIILIKAEEKAKYGNLVEMIDEMSIANIAGYTVMDISPEEKQILENLQ
jgi:biopolymer transport protein ExbD